MNVFTVTNLYPRPDQPNRGLFNAQQFAALAELGTERQSRIEVGNICLVPEWRIWRWRAIRQWRDPFTSVLQTKYVPAFYLPIVGRNLSWRTYCRALTQVARVLEGCDVLLATWLYPDAVATAEVAAQRGVALWTKAHGTDRFHLYNAYRRGRIIRAVERARGIICNCQSMADQLESFGLPRSKLHVVPNGVDTSRFCYRSREEASELLKKEVEATGYNAARMAAEFVRRPVRRKIILFVGNLVSIKGPDVLLEACSRISRDHVMHVLIIGTGPMQKQLRRQLWKLNIAHVVLFLGERPYKEIPFWMNVADVLAVPSRSEGMPNVVLEALASGLPVVATDVGGCREFLSGEAPCRIIPSGNPVALAEALNAVLAESVDRKALAERQAKHLSWRASAEKLLELISKL
ncbi:MAG: glycosyltransferase [Kiritimatiellae bacterium]|nr:glycosyltransferase [Kiritimatiellia bacterium]